MKEELKNLQNTELENVSGGCDEKTYSNYTYKELGISTSELGAGISPTYHGLEVWDLNFCELNGNSNCLRCYHAQKTGTRVVSNICSWRSKEYDPLNK